MRDQLLELFLELVRIPSVTGHEAAMAERVAAYLRELGLEVQSDSAHETSPAECGNLLAFLPATAPGFPVLMLNAHLDTVIHEEPIEPIVEGGVVRTSGDTILGADDKAGVTLILLTLRRLIEEHRPHGDLWAVFTVAEETGLWGARKLDYSRLQPWPEMAFAMDGGRASISMVNAAPSAASLDVTITGRAAHAGVCPEEGCSAIQVAARAIAGMELGRLDEETTANVGMVSGGCARNIVPEVCEIKAEARSHSEEKLTRQLEHMQARFIEAAAAAGAQVKFALGRSYTAFALAEDSAPVRRAWEAAQHVGLDPSTESGGGGSDANIFNERGIPSLILTTGGANVHTPQEEWQLDVAEKCLAWLGEIVEG